MLNRTKLRDDLERQTARDRAALRRWTQRREARLRRGMEEPVLPRFCLVCLVGMAAGAAVAAAGDLAPAFAGRAAWRGALKNASASALYAWAAFAAGLVPGCALQLRRGFEHPCFERWRLSSRGRPRTPPRRRFRRWLVLAVAGLAILGLFRALALWKL